MTTFEGKVIQYELAPATAQTNWICFELSRNFAWSKLQVLTGKQVKISIEDKAEAGETMSEEETQEESKELMESVKRLDDFRAKQALIEDEEDIERKICPILDGPCEKESCAWWSKGECAIKALSESMQLVAEN